MHLRENRNSNNSVIVFDDVVASDLVSSGLFDTLHKFANLEGEKRMMQEVLIDAIECWQSVAAIGLIDENCVTSTRERLYREAHFWIFGDYNNTPFFSFTQICDGLGLNPDFIRRRLVEWRREAGGR
jgi:hypothetical protein